jgi:hypothetical protein
VFFAKWGDAATLSQQKDQPNQKKDTGIRAAEQSPKHNTRARTRALLIAVAVNLTRPFLTRGVRLPWASWAMQHIPESERARIGRMRIAYEIQTSDYSLRVGPLWLRRLFESLSVRLILIRFWIFACIKILFSITLLGIPLGLFVLYRVFLPFPDTLLHKLEGEKIGPISPGWRVSWPYLHQQDPSANLQRISMPEGNPADPNPESGPLLTDRSGSVVTQSLRISNDYLTSSELRDAFILQEDQTERFVLGEQISAEVAGDNIVSGSFVVLPQFGSPVRCRLEIKDESGTVLVSTEKSALRSKAASGPFASLAQRLFKGNTLLSGSGVWETFSVKRSELPTELRVSIKRVHHPSAAAAPSTDDWNGGDQGCKCAFSGPQVLTRRIQQLNPHALLLVLLDGGSEQLTRNPELMPNLNALTQAGFRWNRHFNQHLSASQNFRHLLIGKQDASTTPSGESLFAAARKSGYQTLFFGEWDDLAGSPLPASLFPGTIWQVEVPYYKGLGAALQFKSWVAEHSNEPFLAVVRLSDVSNRLIPPWKFLEIRSFLLSPAGAQGRMRRYEAMLRYMDAALGQALDTARQVAQTAIVDVVVTSPSGFQHESRYQRVASGLLPAHGATFKVSGPLTPDLVHVPFVYARLGGEGRKSGLASAGAAAAKKSFRLTSPTDAHDFVQTLIGGTPPQIERRQDWLHPDHHSQTDPNADQPKSGPRALTLTDSGQMGLVAETDGDRSLFFWAQTIAESGQQIYTDTFPYRLPLGTSLAERAFLYQPETGSSVPLPSDTAATRARLKATYKRLMDRNHEPALMLHGTGPIEIAVSESSNAEPDFPSDLLGVRHYGGRWIWRDTDKGKELRYQVDREQNYWLTISQSRLVTKGTDRLELINGQFQVCGLPINPKSPSTWPAKDVILFLADPPNCALMPIRSTASLMHTATAPSSKKDPVGPRNAVEITAGWFDVGLPEPETCKEDACRNEEP